MTNRARGWVIALVFSIAAWVGIIAVGLRVEGVPNLDREPTASITP